MTTAVPHPGVLHSKCGDSRRIIRARLTCGSRIENP